MPQIISLFPHPDSEASRYAVSCVADHQAVLDDMLKAGYVSVGGYFREMLSGDSPVIPFAEQQAFLQSWESGKSDLVPCVEFASQSWETIFLDFWTADHAF